MLAGQTPDGDAGERELPTNGLGAPSNFSGALGTYKDPGRRRCGRLRDPCRSHPQENTDEHMSGDMSRVKAREVRKGKSAVLLPPWAFDDTK